LRRIVKGDEYRVYSSTQTQNSSASKFKIQIQRFTTIEIMVIAILVCFLI